MEVFKYMNLFIADLKRSIFSVYFLFSVVFVLIILFVSISDEYAFGDMAGVLHLMDLARGGPIGLLAPILATIPFSGSFSIERNNGFLPFVFVRSDKNTYIWSKLLTTGLSGAFVLTIPYVLFFLGLIIRFPNLPLDNSLAGPFGDVAHTSPIVYIFLMFIVTFVFGFIYALIGLAISTIFKQTLFAHVFPFALYLLPAFLFIFFDIAYLEPTTTWDIASNSFATVWTIGGQLFVLGLGSIILFYYKIHQMRFPNE